MSQNQEIIESKLCAYIDGELDADGRTEIEKHLDANPQHRRLLESLKATRDLIKWLPREAAPPELAETLNGQLERSVLLDFDERSLNRNIWPRVLSAAAIVLLTAGLGAAVYFTLPKSQKNATPYATRANDSQSPMPDAAVPEAATEPAKPDDALVATATIEKAAAPLVVMKKEAELAPNPELDRLALDVSQNHAAIVAVANGADAPANFQLQQRPISPNAIVMLVQANSTEQATHDVKNYLESQNIQWKSAGPAGGAEPAASQAASALVDDKQVVMRDSAASYDARRLMHNELTTRPDMPGSAYSSLSTPRATQSQATLSLASSVYVARMSRQQAINLNNSVRQGKSQRSELKDLNAPAVGGGLQSPSQNASFAFGQQQNGQNQLAQGQIATPSAAPAPIDQERSRRSAFGTAGPATQQDQIAGGAGRGGFGGGAGAVGIRPVTTEPTSLPTSLPATTEPFDAPVDVVIVVQPVANATTEPAAVPQTEPAASQPAMLLQPTPQTQPASH